ncbi:hypothetical protein L3X38_027625 [Prunus dulcis]|uniref:Uncharacterized protein n=1 Tax=Prunus dulcis TaxID=3755 RepID=A0AAD4VPJ4_PRUDU|nr:hypothetical protein L3X38_027625 [Prunus dulcis]
MDDNDLGDIGFDPYEFANVIGDGDQPCTLVAVEGRQRCNLERGCASKVGVDFSPIPRFKRMFQSHKTAKSLTWHATRKSVDGHMSRPADSPSRKLVDDKWPEFGKEPRNLRLALSSDGSIPTVL